MNSPMQPRIFRIAKVRRELSDTFTFDLHPEGGGNFTFSPGQFNMLYLFGVGEIPISISGDPANKETLTHTIRAVGGVTRAMEALKEGDALGVRGPFGNSWPVEEAFGGDLVIIAGGVGLAPLRPAIYQAIAQRKRFGRVIILYGARTPADILYRKELEKWRGQFDLEVDVTVDRASGDWLGHAGVVTKLIPKLGLAGEEVTALVCGPEIMMWHAAQSLEKTGVTPDKIFVSMERNMKCGIGLCGHCQMGPTIICKDGPVYRFDQAQPLMAIREL